MDPDETLRVMLAIAHNVIANRQSDDESIALAEYVQDMHNWLAHGGLLPARWYEGSTPRRSC